MSEWEKISSELHDFLTHLRRSSYLLNVESKKCNDPNIYRNTFQKSNDRWPVFDGNQGEIHKSVIKLKHIISKFLYSIHWLMLQVGHIESILKEGTTMHLESNVSNELSAYLHVHLAIQFTMISCFQYLKFAIENIEVRELQPSMNEDNKSTNEEYVVPRFDVTCLSHNIPISKGSQDNTDIFRNYELSSSNIVKIMRLHIKQLLCSIVNVANNRYNETERILDNLRSASSIFGCGCIQELLLIVFYFIDTYYPKQFWAVFSYAIKVQEERIQNDNGEQQKFYRFFWTFLHHFFPLVLLGENIKNLPCEEKTVKWNSVQKFSTNDKSNSRTQNESTTSVAEKMFEESKEIILSYLRSSLKLLDETFLEQNLSNMLLVLIQIISLKRTIPQCMNDISIANIVELSLLWDVFIKRLNTPFKVAAPFGGQSKQSCIVTGLTVLAKSHDSWISNISETIMTNNLDNTIDDFNEKQVYNDPAASNLTTYHLFVRLLTIHLNPHIKYSRENTLSLQSKSKANKAVKQFIGRIRSKIPSAKIQSLEELGIHNLFTMFIGLILCQQGDKFVNFAGIAAIAEAVLGLAKEEIKPENSIMSKKLTTYLRGLVAVLVLLIKIADKSSKSAIESDTAEDMLKEKKRLSELMASFVEILAQRVEVAVDASSSQPTFGLDKMPFSAADNAIRIYADLLQDPDSLSSTSLLSQACLIHAGLGKYLQQKQRLNSGIADIKNVLISVIAVTTKIRRYYQTIDRSSSMSLSVEQKKIKEGIDETCLNIWKYVYPVVKSSLCTYCVGGNVAVSTKSANQVAEFIIAMTLLSQSLSNCTSPPNTSNTNPIESFSEMFKYYSHSPVVHPSVASAFLLNVVQHKRSFELDSTQLQLLLRGWVRCSTLLLADDETIGPLSQYILPLCKELACGNSSPQDQYDGVAIFFKELSKLHIKNSFSQTMRKRYDQIFDSYIDCINRNFQQILTISGSPAALFRLYEVGSLVVKNCARLLYVEKVVNKLQPIVQKLFTSSAMLKEEYNMTNDMKASISGTLPDYIRGICTIQQLKTDQFAIRTLRYVYVAYLHRFEINVQHPFIVAFKKPVKQIDSDIGSTEEDYPMSCFVNYNEMYAQFFIAIRSEFLVKLPNHKQRIKLKHTLEFVLTLVKYIPDMTAYVLQTIFSTLLDLRLTISNDDCGVRNIAAELISVLVKESNSTQYLSHNTFNVTLCELEKIINSHLGFYAEETFQLLMALSTLDKKLVELLIPCIESCVTALEKKRGLQASEEHCLAKVQIMQSINGYLGDVDNAWNDYNGEALAKLLSFRDVHVFNPKLHLENPESAVEKILGAQIDEIVASHLRCCWAVAVKGDFIEAYNCQAALVQFFVKLLSSQKDDNWPLPIMYTVCLDLRLFAGKADSQLSSKGGKPGETLEKAAEHIMSCFRTCALDSKSTEDVTKRWGMLNIVNQLFKIYFRVNKLHLCKPLIRAIESSPLKDRYPKSQQVTYKYYVGRKYMFDNNFKEAEEYLKFAFEHCYVKSRANKRSILIYLIPVKMLLGQMPEEMLLRKYDLLQFKEVVLGVKQGNLLRLNEALESNEKFFIKCGIYLILEKLKVITYRNLFKKVSILMKTHQIPIEAFLVALKMMKVEDIDADETQCIIANLIYEGKIKGYISHQHQKLVVSKQNAFPALNQTTTTIPS